jgi:protein-tyrosine phosphatase
MDGGFVDIHCHVLPALDDGPTGWDESLRMAEIAVQEGVAALVATPHQLGGFSHNSAERIRSRWEEFRQLLAENDIPLRVELGADVRLEPELPQKIADGSVLTLGRAGRYVLVELPAEVVLRVESLFPALRRLDVRPVLTHPERSLPLARDIHFLRQWVDLGGIIQLTGASLLGAFGLHVQSAAERLLREGLVHVVATDAHGARRRRPLFRRVYQRLCEVAGSPVADLLCKENPSRVLAGQEVVAPPALTAGPLPRIFSWLWRKAG